MWLISINIDYYYYYFRLYTANIGDSRAVLCEEDENGRIIASQLSDDHNVFNPDEQDRLRKLGLDTGQLLQLRRLGPFQITRSIGDYLIKGGYTEVDVLRQVYMFLHVVISFSY